ncbi:hypothetical protein CRG98_012607 [Punica granatum]|uniref:Uncharacterized protein n=1 Tax=Punica granatum TaxID=22663 RepID=A0A2I0KER4_PUNGR|nr:hypothetical protein CRG98_012607 [Punica granatum]
MSLVESPSCMDPNVVLVGARMRAFGSRGLGVSTCPGCLMDMREKELPLPVYDPKVEGRNYLHSEKLRSGGLNIGNGRAIRERSSVM